MPNPVKENVNNGQIIQVFVPNRRLAATNSVAVVHGDVVRFTVAGQYEMNSDGVKVPFPAGHTIGVPRGITSIALYNEAGDTLTAQVVEVM